MNINLNHRTRAIIDTDQGKYFIKTDADGKTLLEKLDKEELEEDSKLELELEEREYKYTITMDEETRKLKVTLFVPSLRYLPLPAESWPKCSHWLHHLVEDFGSTVNIYTIMDGKETTLSFTTAPQRDVVLRLMQSEMRRRRANGEKYCLTVRAVRNRFLSQ